METLQTWWATELYPMRERDQFGVSGEFEVVLAADAQETIAALQVDKENAQDANRLLRRELDKLREKYDAECVMSEGLQSQLTQRTAELEEAKAELEQERVRLASCLIAAEGGTKDIVKQGDYGWSPAYQATLNLQAELERVRGQYADLRKMVLALPKVEGEVYEMVASYRYDKVPEAWFHCEDQLTALLKHRQGMEG